MTNTDEAQQLALRYQELRSDDLQRQLIAMEAGRDTWIRKYKQLLQKIADLHRGEMA